MCSDLIDVQFERVQVLCYLLCLVKCLCLQHRLVLLSGLLEHHEGVMLLCFQLLVLLRRLLELIHQVDGRW